MATHNSVRLVGYLLENPTIANEGQKGAEKVFIKLRTIRRDADDVDPQRFEDIYVFYDGTELIEKVKKDPIFIPIMAKISIPFNLENREDIEGKKENVLKKTFHSLALGNDLNNGLLQAFRYNTSSFDKEINGQIYKFLLTKLKLNVFQNSNKSGVGIIFFNVTQERLNEKIRREFFQNASHELKTPLTTIIGYEEMIDNGIIDDPKEVEKAREAVIKESKRMQSVIEDMLALSSLEYNMSNEKKVDIDVKSVIKDVISSFEYLINERNIDCHVRLKDVTLKMVPKDLDRLVRNLVSNAIKYNKENGKIIITLSDKYLSVKDNGIGIDKKDLTRIFERFYRVDKGRSREQGGTGLGLAIVKHICLNYGFKIEVDSKVMQGSEFEIYFNN